MSKRFSERLTELERLESEYADDPALDAVAHLSDDAVLAEAFTGLRSGKLHYLWGELREMVKEGYWRGVAERAWGLCIERQAWICPLTEEEVTIVCRALRSGTWIMHMRSVTPPDVWYDPAPPPPFPAGCWETAEYQALKRLAKALCMWADLWWGFPDVPPMPATIEEVIRWTETMGRQAS